MRVFIIFLMVFSAIAVPVCASPEGTMSFIVKNIIPSSIVNAGTPTLSEVGHNYSFAGLNTVDLRNFPGGLPVEDVFYEGTPCNSIAGAPAAHMYLKSSMAYETDTHQIGTDWTNAGATSAGNYANETSGNCSGVEACRYYGTDSEGIIELVVDPIDSARTCLNMEDDGAGEHGVKLWNDAEERGNFAQLNELTGVFGYVEYYIPDEPERPYNSNIWQFMNASDQRCTEHSTAPQSKLGFTTNGTDQFQWKNEAGDNTWYTVLPISGYGKTWVPVSLYVGESSGCDVADGDVYVWTHGVPRYADDGQKQRSCRGEGYCNEDDGPTWWFQNSLNNYGSSNNDGEFLNLRNHMYSSAYLGPTRN